MTSLTTELYGILSSVISLYLVWLQNKHRYPGIKTFPEVKIYSDNKEAIEKSNEEAKRLNISEYLKPKYDLEC